MINIYSILFYIIVLFIYIFNNSSIVTESNLINKFLIFLALLIINISINIYICIKEEKIINGINIIRLSIYYSFIGTFAYIIFYDLVQIKNNGISKNVNVQILLYSIFITAVSIIFYNKLLL